MFKSKFSSINFYLAYAYPAYLAYANKSLLKKNKSLYLNIVSLWVITWKITLAVLKLVKGVYKDDFSISATIVHPNSPPQLTNTYLHLMYSSFNYFRII